MSRILITGANGNIGQRLVRELLALTQAPVRALVRSERAKASLSAALPEAAQLEVLVGDYADQAVVTAAAQDCVAAVHLVGIIKESANNSFHAAHVATSKVLAQAAEATSIQQVVYLSILGSTPGSTNPCLRSKAEAEQVLLNALPAAKILRVPMVLGEGDYASAALIGRAHKSLNFVLRAQSLEQPIYVGDVVAAVQAALASPLENMQLDLAGPESLPRSELIQRTARLLGRSTKVVSLPVDLGYAAAFVMEKLSSNPPVTRAMLGVLDHDDRVDAQPALQALELELTPLDATLQHCIAAFTQA
jgi:uncharacterized protein YbjT (DUF2867 family)